MSGSKWRPCLLLNQMLLHISLGDISVHNSTLQENVEGVDQSQFKMKMNLRTENGGTIKEHTGSCERQ